MPQLWHYLLRIFFKIFGLCFLGSLGIGLLLKHKKIAEFIAAGASFKQASILALGFMCRPMPFVIAISALAAAFFLSYRMSASSEITAMRSSGLNLNQIFFPIYCMGAGLSLSNFFITSELIPYMQLVINEILLEEIQINPLVLLQQNSFPFFKQAYVNMDLTLNGTHADRAFLIFKNEKHDRLAILTADTLDYDKNNNLEGEKFSIITELPASSGYDHLFIDNQEKISTPASIFRVPIKRKTTIKDVQIYPLQTLIKLGEAPQKIEMIQRISKGLLPLSFVVLGVSFGLFIGRKPRLHYPLLALLVFLTFASFFVPRSVQSTLLISFLPHLFIILAALYKQKRLIQGVS